MHSALSAEDVALLSAIRRNPGATREELLEALGPRWHPGNPGMKLAFTLQRFLCDGTLVRRRGGGFALGARGAREKHGHSATLLVAEKMSVKIR
jgi:hypothetical protein